MCSVRKILMVAMLAVVFLSMSLMSCNRESKVKTVCAVPCQSRISSLDRVVRGDVQRYTDELQEISREISQLTNANDRLDHYRILARELLSFDFNAFTLPQRESVSDKYMPPFYGLVQCMTREGATEQEIGDVVVKGFKKLAELCFPTNLCRLGGAHLSIESRQQAAYVKGLRSRLKNDISVWERVYIPHVFDRFSKEATKRFLRRWQEEVVGHDPIRELSDEFD